MGARHSMRVLHRASVPMNLTLISVPYDSGLRGIRMGSGPEHLIKSGLPGQLAAAGHDVRIEVLRHESEPPAEIRTGFELMRQVAHHVRGARRKHSFPLVLSGNCNVAIGTIAGFDDEIGIVWLDAHPDFQTPETTRSGFLDATGLATATGHCWATLVSTVPGFSPVPESHVVLLGARDFQAEEIEALDASEITVLPSEVCRDAAVLEQAIENLSKRVGRVYLHIDLDALDPAFGAANEYAAAGGLSPSDVSRIIATVRGHLPIGAIGIASFDPTVAPDGPMTDTALSLILNAVSLIVESTL